MGQTNQIEVERTLEKLRSLSTGLLVTDNDVRDVKSHAQQGFSVCEQFSSEGDHKVGSIANLKTERNMITLELVLRTSKEGRIERFLTRNTKNWSYVHSVEAPEDG